MKKNARLGSQKVGMENIFLLIFLKMRRTAENSRTTEPSILM